jgi:hypothetical protein
MTPAMYQVTKVAQGGAAIWIAPLGQLLIAHEHQIVTATWEPGDKIELTPNPSAPDGYMARRIGSIDTPVPAVLTR